MWSTTHQPINNEWNTPMSSQWQWNVVSKQSGWPQTTPSASVNGYSNSWTSEPAALPSKPKVVQQKTPISAVESSGMSNQQQYYFVPVSNQSSWDYVVPAPMTAMKKIEVPTIVPTSQQQQPRSQPEFVNVKSAHNPWGPNIKSPKKNTPIEEPTSIDQLDPKKKVEIEDELTQQSLYKTELCRSWTETGSCRYGNKCQFAHGKDELRNIMRHPKYKTEICKTFHTQGTCPYGTRCRFIHNPSLRANILAQQQQQQQQQQQAQVQFPVESEHIPVPTPVVEHSMPSPVVSSPQMIPTPQPTHSIWSAPLLVPSPVSAEAPLDSAFGALSIASTSPEDSPSKRASIGRLPIFQRFTN